MKLSDAVGHWGPWNHLGQHCWGEAYSTLPCCLQKGQHSQDAAAARSASNPQGLPS